jgi:hypothetical protein
MKDCHDPGPVGKGPRSARQAALEADLFEVTGDAPAFLTCACGRAPVGLRVFADPPTDARLDILAWCASCTVDAHFIVTLTPSGGRP